MTSGGGGRERRLARRLLGLVFDPDEAAEIVRDVSELTRDRRGVRRAVRFWALVLSYPLAEWWEMLRTWRDAWGQGRTVGPLIEDVGFAWRALRRRPGFGLTAATILAAGLGSIIAVHSVVKGVLLDPLEFPEPDRLMTLWMTDARGQRVRMTPGNVRDAAELTDMFAGVSAFRRSELVLEDPATGDARMLQGAEVTPEYFSTLGVAALRGRTFTEADADPYGESVVVLSERAWRQVFGGDPEILGRSLKLGRETSRVIGIVPTAPYPTSATVSGELPFTDGEQDYFRLIRFAGDFWTRRQFHNLGAVARLRDDVTPQSAMAALEGLSSRLRAEYAENAEESIVMSPLREEVIGDVRFGLILLFAAVVLVFVIATVNVGSLFLLRAEDRRGETALLGAIGAPARRILRQRIFEAMIVSVAAAGSGILAAGWLVSTMRALVPYRIPRLADVTVEPVAAGGAVLLALLLAILVGVLPSWVARGGSDHGPAVRSTPGRREGRVQAGLIAGQAGLAVVVLVGALLLVRSASALQAIDPGYDSADAWVLRLHNANADRLDPIVDVVRSLPGVAGAALTSNTPLERTWEDGFRLVGRSDVGGDTARVATIRPYGEGYFDVAGIALVAGRLPDRLEHAGQRRLAVVNDAFRRAYLVDGLTGDALAGAPRVWVPNGDIRMGERQSVFEIIGVVEDVRFVGPRFPSEPAIYLPFEHFAVNGRVLLVKPEDEGSALLPALREAIREAAPETALEMSGTLATLRSQALARPRFNMMLLVALSGVALLLCTVGAYGIVARAVATRRREIGVRAALGAAGASIVRSVVGRALTPLAIGAASGLVVALGTARLLTSLLFEMSPYDPVSLTCAPLILLGVGGAGAFLPSLRALAVDPAESLRAE